MRFINESRKHLEASKETYFSHMKFAVITGFELIFIGIASIIHGLVPAFFSFTAAKKIIDLYHKRLISHPNPLYRKYAQILSLKEKRLDFLKE